jgi:hypothetical protein
LLKSENRNFLAEMETRTEQLSEGNTRQRNFRFWLLWNFPF